MGGTARLSAFLAAHEARAFRLAQFATRNREDALDLVQDAMLTLARRYPHLEESAWRALFYRILESRIRDWQRRSTVRNRLRQFFAPSEQPDAEDPLEQQADTLAAQPDTQLEASEFRLRLETALRNLPWRQQQAFLLRLWEGLDIRETAVAMACSESSVKTHYARALEKLRQALEEHR